MENKLNLPDFKAWREKAIHTQSGLVFAPEDFYTVDVQGKKKKFFTFAEALEYEKMILLPNGWRLPTDEEWRDAAQEWKNEIAQKLHLTHNGYIDEMIRYNLNPASVPAQFQSDGYYWSSERANYNDTHIRYLHIWPGRFANPVVYVCGDDVGMNIRCVQMT